jgi:hypothetical protein
MRATIGRIAVVMLVSIGASGCTSGSSMFAWWHKKPSNTALTDAPKYSPTNPSTASSPTLPSAGQNPSNSLSSVSSSPWPANGATAGAGANQMQASAAAYPNSYPSTSYGPAKLSPTAANTTASPWGATVPTTPNYGSNGITASGAISAGVTSNGGFVGPSAANTAPAGGYGSPSPVTAANPANSSLTGIQPQSGYYNPAYDGGTPNRYASGATIPGSVPSTVAAQTTPPSNSGPSYYTADTRGAMNGSPNAAYGGASPTSYTGNATTGGYTNPTASPTNSAATAPMNSYQAAPNGYAPGNTGYQPAATSTPPGNTGYNPTDVYSTPSPAASSAASTLPTRSDSEYRPGGTGTYNPAGGTSAQPGTNNNSQGSGVMPASYQAPVATGSSSGEVYGAYQGATPSKEPAYGASNPNASSTAGSATRTW